MTRRAAFRGQPLLLFGGVIAGWVALRVVLWEPPFAAIVAGPGPTSPVAVAPKGSTAVRGVALPVVRKGGSQAAIAHPAEPGAPGSFVPEPVLPPLWTVPMAPPPPLPQPMNPPLDPPRAAIGHSVMLALGLSRMPLPAAFAAYLQGTVPPSDGVRAAPSLAAVPPGRTPAFVSRWSADGWLLLRRDGVPGSPGPILSDRPSYGRSQAGAVVRYALAPASPLRPRAYLRGAAALSGVREREVAAGLSLRPLPGVPLRVAAEARVSEGVADTRVRPAAYAVTEFPPLDLPLGLRSEVYVQAGYVGGEFRTAFVDGQARAERPLLRAGETEVSAGAGAWSGAQKGSARLDIGPTAAVTFRLGEARGKVAADYRFRVAGDAEPASGPALTLSAGF